MARDAGHIIIVGAGIGGLTAALTLSRAGWRVTVLERAATLSEVGAGIQLSPNASRILIDQDLGTQLRAGAVYPDAIRIFSTRSGREVTSLPLGAGFAARYGAPYMVIHRADLQGTLLAGARSRDRIDVRLGQDIRAIRDTGTAVEVETAADETFVADGLIGADGVRSAIRTEVLGQAPARYSGRSAFRATIPIEAVPEAMRHVTCVWMAPDAHLVHYPISGGTLLNLVAVTEGAWIGEEWAMPVARERMLAELQVARANSWPQTARDLLRQPESWTKWALAAVDPRFDWSRGRITLLGDAAHAMLPFAAQGGAMAIEDAEVLASALTAERDVATALAAYEAARKPRVSAIVDLAATNGRIYHLSAMAATLRDLALQALPARVTLARQDWIYAWRAI
jgi:salicylate hydroxylase